MSTIHKESTFHVGDRVHIELGRRKVPAFVVEDRGEIGVGSRRLYQISVPMDPFEPMIMELPEGEIEAATGDSRRLPLDKVRMMEYLVNGGLVSMLRENLSGGKNQPAAWLCLDILGNITHTFDPERGIAGGQIVPAAALRGRKIAAEKQDSVASFIQSFGLTREDAENSISQVGVSS